MTDIGAVIEEVRADINTVLALEFMPDVATLERLTETPDGAGGTTQVWGWVAQNVPLDYRPSNARRDREAGRLIETGDYVLRLPYRRADGTDLDARASDRLRVAARGAEPERVFDLLGVRREAMSVFLEVEGRLDENGAGPSGTPIQWQASGGFVFNEAPAGAINGSNATFTTAFAFVPESVQVSINGLEQRAGVDFVTSGQNTIIFTDSPQTGDYVETDYQKA